MNSKGGFMADNGPAPADNASADAARIGPEDTIERSDRPLGHVVVPILALLGALLFFTAVSNYFALDCKNYPIMRLAYPLFFGAAGVVLGGAVRLQGKFSLFGFPWTGELVGGVGAAAIGFLIVSMLKVPPCELRHELQITDLPVAQPDREQFQTVKYFVTVEPDPNMDVQISAGSNNKKTLKIAFQGRFSSSLLIRAYQLNGVNYEYLASCEIKFIPPRAEPNDPSSVTVHRLAPDQQLTLAFNPEYFAQLKAAQTNSTVEQQRNLCLKGQFDADNTNNFILDFAITPLEIKKREKGIFVAENGDEFDLYFETTKPKPISDAKEAAKLAAKVDVNVSGEVLTSAGTGVASSAAAITPVPTNVSSSAAVQLNAGAAAPSPGCLSSGGDSDTRNAVDRFLLGDDLDKPTRRQIYTQWSHINCYVLPLIVDVSRGASSQVRARALKLLINAIANNSTQADNLLYWQPNGANKRDFRKMLPFVQQSDLESIFGLVQLDDDLVRGMAVQFIRTLPIDAFERLFRGELAALTASPGSMPKNLQQRVAVAASWLYYNRITDWLNGTATAATQKSIAKDFDQSQNWTRDVFLDVGAKPYSAMEHYGRGIVERELQLDDRGIADFTTMLDLLKQTDETYPSRSIHIAQALAIGSGGSDAVVKDILRQIQSAEEPAAATPLDDSPPFAGKTFPLYSGPRQDYPKLDLSIGSKDRANLLLHEGNWFLVRAPNRIGWITSTP